MPPVTAKGEFRLEVSPDEITLLAKFGPSAEGQEWGADSVKRVFMEAGLPVPTQAVLDGLLRKWAGSRTPVDEVVSKGVEPQQPTAEEVQWAEFEPAPDMEPFMKEAIIKAGQPRLFRLRVEKVKVETVVRKPAALPFLPPKEETVVSYEKKETREPVSVDTQVKGFHYVAGDAKIGTVVPSKPGKPGKSVYGKPIAPNSLDNPEFICGDGLRREGREVFSTRAGFLRYGDAWADIVPFARHSWSVTRSADGGSFLLDFSPGNRKVPLPSGKEILAKAVELGAIAEQLLSEREIDAAILESLGAEEPLCSRVISADKDALISIDVSEDLLKATLTLCKARGRGRPLSLQALSLLLKDKGIKIKSPDKFKADVLAFAKGTDPELRDYVIAEGRPPAAAKPRTITWSCAFIPDAAAAKVRERVTANASAYPGLECLEEFPLSAPAKIAFVQEGKEIAALSKAEATQAGEDVFGKPLLAGPAGGPSLKTCGGVAFSRDSATPLVTGIVMAYEKEGITYLRALPYRDGEVEVSLSPDFMKAEAVLTGHLGAGSPLSAEAVMRALENLKVRSGVDEEAVKKAVAQAAASAEPLFGVVVAHGTPAAAGGCLKLSWAVSLPSASGASIRANGTADWRERNNIVNVEAGQLLATLARAGAEGRAGVDLLGRKVEPPKTAQDDRVECDAGVKAEPGEGGSVRFLAAKAGELRFENGKISVTESHGIKGDVDMHSGNVKFQGEVRITGSVMAGAMVMAGGDVYVGQGAEGCLISSEGSVRIALGMRGQRRGVVRASKGISALFAEQATLLAVEDVQVKNSLVACKVKTNGRLVLASDKGQVIGGSVQARKGIDVMHLGSQTGTPTNVSFGQNYLMADQIEVEQREIEKVKAAILECDRKMADAQKANAPQLAGLRQNKVMLLKLMEKRSLRLLNFRDQFEEHFPSEVRVRGTVYPGTILESHGRFLEITKEKSKVSFSFDPSTGHILEKPLS